MSDFKELVTLLEKFRDERDWGQFDDSKNLALALSIEAAELNELFLWKKETESEKAQGHQQQSHHDMFLSPLPCSASQKHGQSP